MQWTGSHSADYSLYMSQVLLLRLRQACVHPYLAQTKDDGAGAAAATEPQEGAEGIPGE